MNPTGRQTRIAFAVAGEIYRKGLIRCGDELRVAHGTGPASGQTGSRDIAALKDTQRRDQLFLEKGPATPVIGQRRCRRHDRHISAPFPVKAFQPPHGGDDFGRHAVARLYLAQHALVARECCAPFGDTFVRCRNGEVIFKRAAEFRLVTVPFDHPR